MFWVTPHKYTCCLTFTYRGVLDARLQRVVKLQLLSLASRQRILLVVVQKQMHLEEMYLTLKAKLSAHHPTVQGSPTVRQQPGHLTPSSTSASSEGREEYMVFPNSCYQGSQRNESPRPITQASPRRAAPLGKTKGRTKSRSPACSATRGKHSDMSKEKISSCHGSISQPGNTLQHISFQMKRKNALIQTREEDSSCLSKLLLKGKISPGSVLKLMLKVWRDLLMKSIQFLSFGL